MRRLIMTGEVAKLFTAAMAGVCLLGAASLATAGNHLKCYKGKDALGVKHKYTGGVLLSNTGLAPESGCIISTPPKICCDAVDKIGFVDENNNPPPGGGPTGNTTKFCCYKVSKCTNPNTVITGKDQFGQHSLTIKKPSLICAPASPSGAFLDDASLF